MAKKKRATKKRTRNVRSKSRNLRTSLKRAGVRLPHGYEIVRTKKRKTVKKKAVKKKAVKKRKPAKRKAVAKKMKKQVGTKRATKQLRKNHIARMSQYSLF